MSTLNELSDFGTVIQFIYSVVKKDFLQIYTES